MVPSVSALPQNMEEPTTDPKSESSGTLLNSEIQNNDSPKKVENVVSP